MGVPRMLYDIMADAVESQPDIELVRGEPDLDLASQVRASGANVVIAGMVDDDLPADCEELTRMRPPLTVMMVADRGRRAVLHRLQLQAIDLGEMSAEGLLAAGAAAVALALGR